MKDYKLKQRNLRASHTGLVLELGRNYFGKRPQKVLWGLSVERICSDDNRSRIRNLTMIDASSKIRLFGTVTVWTHGWTACICLVYRYLPLSFFCWHVSYHRNKQHFPRETNYHTWTSPWTTQDDLVELVLQTTIRNILFKNKQSRRCAPRGKQNVLPLHTFVQTQSERSLFNIIISALLTEQAEI